MFHRQNHSSITSRVWFDTSWYQRQEAGEKIAAEQVFKIVS